MTRDEIHSQFFKRFCTPIASLPVELHEIESTQMRLGIEFPDSYRHFILTYGAVHSPELLSLIVGTQSELWDIHSFMPAIECAQMTECYREAGMSNRLIAFAGDSGGSVFCFESADLSHGRADDAAIWFFDHDFCEDSKVAESFDSWLESYLKIQ
jgi:hypothetical protein